MDLKLADKLEALRQRLRACETVVVAYSAGVDSALLLKLAVDTLGPDCVLAATGRSPSVPHAELESAASLAAEIGAPHFFVDTDEFDNPNYTSNPQERCYFCKTELYTRLQALAAERGFRCLLSGTNADDLGDYRPGIQAAGEQQVIAPLADAGITKQEIRTLAAEVGLEIHDKPASPCLSSRIPYGQEVTPEKLRRIDEAETRLRQLGFRECRVRHHEQLARIEVPPSELERFADPTLRTQIDHHFRSLGFHYVTLDLRGFRSGSLNEIHLGAGLQPDEQHTHGARTGG